MEYKRLNYFLALLLSIGSAFAVQVQQTESIAESKGLAYFIVFGMVIFFAIVLLAGLILLLFFIVYKIYSKLVDYDRKRKDFLYDRFLLDANQCHSNHDPALKYRNWRLFFLFWKREPIFMRGSTQNKAPEVLGAYNGECRKKEGFAMVSVYKKMGFFQMMDYIVIIPDEIYDKVVEKFYVGKKKVIMLNIDAIDEYGNTDYYFLPLIKDEKRQKFIDFADKIQKDYVDKVVHRTVIKENLLESKDAITKAVEMNPYLQHKRRGE